MRQLDFIRRLLSCFHPAGPPSGPQLFQKQPPTSPQSHSSTWGFDKDVHCGGPHPPSQPFQAPQPHQNFPRSPGEKGPSKPLNLRYALTVAVWPVFLRSATIPASCLSELLCFQYSVSVVVLGTLVFFAHLAQVQHPWKAELRLYMFCG